MGYVEKRVVTERYVARVTIQKVERTIDPNVKEGQRERVLDDVTSFTIKEDNMDVLIRKLGMHLEIVNRFGDEGDALEGVND